MKARLVIQVLALALLGCFCLVSMLAAQDAQIQPGSERPMFTRFAGNLRSPKTAIEAASTPLQTWNGSFSHNGTTFHYNMVGTSPFTTNTSSTIQVEIIPIKIVITSRNHTQTTFDPSHILSNKNSVTTNAAQSPVFVGIPFSSGTNGSVSMGTTQYIDAYQRANFWGTVQTNISYHVLLSPTVLAERTLSPPTRSGKTGVVFGFNAGLVDINWFDSQLHTLISNLAIQPNTLPIFLTYDVYLTQNGSCCIGGYHSVTGLVSAPQSYAHATYVDRAGAFAQDVSALSHEVGEWMDDPLVVNTGGNNTPCGSLENGDPLENNANFGAFTYKGTNGFTYNLQDLVTLPYFGAPPSTSVDGEFTFHNEGLTVCQNGA